jgi:hypothetical protein
LPACANALQLGSALLFSACGLLFDTMGRKKCSLECIDRSSQKIPDELEVDALELFPRDFFVDACLCFA